MDKQQTNILNNINVVITGAGRGLGAALALSLSDMGYNVVLCGRSIKSLNSVADQIETRTGRRSKTIEIDLANADKVRASADEITQCIPVVDVLINNGAMWLEHRQSKYDADEVMSVINSTVSGTFLFTQALLPLLQKSKRPDIVTIGSISALPNASLHNVSVPFYAAKHGQAAVAEGLRQMLWGTPIRSICIHPPWLKDISPMDDEWNTTTLRKKGEQATNRDIVDAVIYAITLPRHITIASMVIDSDSRGMDARGHF